MNNKPKGKRYNKGKNRIELMPERPLMLIGDVYTGGAHKYTVYKDENGNEVLGKDIPFEDRHKYEIVDDGADNWRKGLSWTEATGSVLRHIMAYKNGEDIDPELGTYHLANAAWGIISLLEFYQTHPELDDRKHAYLEEKKIGLDIDGVLADFVGAINTLNDREGHEPIDWNDPHVVERFKEVKRDEDFWLNLKPLVTPQDVPFEPHCYITSRSIDINVTKRWLHTNGFADAPVYSIGVGESKVDTAIASGIDYFIDDYYKNFVELNQNKICTFLMNRSYNSKYNVGYKRIKDFADFKQRFL